MTENKPADQTADRFEEDTTAKELLASDVDATENSRLPVPSTNPATNLIIADIVVRSLSVLLRNKVEEKVAKASFDDEDRAKDLINGRTIVTSMALYGASKLAMRSPFGLGIVTAALVGKTLYDRGRTVQRKRRSTAKRLTSTED